MPSMLPQQTPTQTALQNNPIAPSQMDVGDAMNVLDNSGTQAPPTMSQPRGQPADQNKLMMVRYLMQTQY